MWTTAVWCSYIEKGGSYQTRWYCQAGQNYIAYSAGEHFNNAIWDLSWPYIRIPALVISFYNICMPPWSSSESASFSIRRSLGHCRLITWLSDKKIICAIGGACQIVGPAPDLSPVVSVYHPIGFKKHYEACLLSFVVWRKKHN